MDTPESVALGAILTGTVVTFTGDPTNAFWVLIRDLGTVTFQIDLFAETVGPGRELLLTSQTGALTAGVDNYPVAITGASFNPGAGARQGLYELGVVITFFNGGTLIGGISAYAGDAVIQVT
jgi:hypothetical protein